jgi:hypothetical protein
LANHSLSSSSVNDRDGSFNDFHFFSATIASGCAARRFRRLSVTSASASGWTTGPTLYNNQCTYWTVKR